jgi:hypothetical protein
MDWNERYNSEKTAGLGHELMQGIHTLVNTFAPVVPTHHVDTNLVNDLTDRVQGLTQFIQHPGAGVSDEYVRNQMPGLRDLKDQLGQAERGHTTWNVNPKGIISDLGAAATGVGGYLKGRSKEITDHVNGLFGQK